MVEKWLEPLSCKEPPSQGLSHTLYPAKVSLGLLLFIVARCSVALLWDKWEVPPMLGRVGEADITLLLSSEALHLEK